MKVTLVDYNKYKASTILDALSVCRDKQCSVETLHHCITAKPTPHLSALEFCWFCFKIEGISRALTHQLVRHRHFSFMQRSQRHVDETDFDYVNPFTNKNDYLKAIFDVDITEISDSYLKYLENGAAKEDARYILPNATATTIFVAGNGRTWFEWLNKRLCKKYVQPEHYELAREILIKLKDATPQILWNTATPCFKCKQCKE